MEQKEINRKHLAHAGTVLNNFVILGLVLLFFATVFDLIQILFVIAIAIVVVILVMILLLSLFSLYGWFKDLDVSSWFDPTGQFFSSIKEVFHVAVPYVFGITTVLAVASIVLLLQDRNDKHAGRIAVSAIAIFFGITAMCATFL